MARPSASRAARSRSAGVREPDVAVDERLGVGCALGRVEEGEREVHAAPLRPETLEDRLHDRLVAGAAAEVAGEQIDDLIARVGAGWRARKSVAAIRIPGVQKPHCSACCSRKARCSGFSSPSAARPSTVRISAPSAWTASSRHERTDDAVEDHGAGAADAVLAADVRPGEAERVAEEVRQQQARLRTGSR